MIFSKPRPFREAVQANQVRRVLPTDLSSSMLEEIEPEILLRARFSAKVRSADHLGVLDNLVREITGGKTDFATARLALQQHLAAAGYTPGPEHAGGLQDFSSPARTDLQLRMNVEQARNYGHWKQGQDADILDAFPAQEFLRVESREKERDDWHERWLRAGGPRTGAWPRMIALKNDPCWSALSRFGTPWPPFDFSSGMGVEDVSRREAEGLGLITRDEIPKPQDMGFNEDLAATPATQSQVLRAALEATGVGLFDAAGVFRAITN
jgi:hypothetical protein